jgi:hypothetical protein
VGLLEAASPEAISTELLEAVLREVGYRDPYEVINDWTKDGRLSVSSRAGGDELIPTRMGKLVKGDILVREDSIGTVRVTRVVKLGNSRVLVHYARPDGSTDEYLTWESTHARIRSVTPVDASIG